MRRPFQLGFILGSFLAYSVSIYVSVVEGGLRPWAIPLSECGGKEGSTLGVDPPSLKEVKHTVAF